MQFDMENGNPIGLWDVQAIPVAVAAAGPNEKNLS